MFQLVELKMSVDGLEKERDFYFGKLRDIEVMCQDCDNGGDPPPIVQKILEVLYATEVIFIFITSLQLLEFLWINASILYFSIYLFFQDGFAPPEELEGDGLAPDDEEEY